MPPPPRFTLSDGVLSLVNLSRRQIFLLDQRTFFYMFAESPPRLTSNRTSNGSVVFTFMGFDRYPCPERLTFISVIHLSSWGLRALLKGPTLAAWWCWGLSLLTSNQSYSLLKPGSVSPLPSGLPLASCFLLRTTLSLTDYLFAGWSALHMCPYSFYSTKAMHLIWFCGFFCNRTLSGNSPEHFHISFRFTALPQLRGWNEISMKCD